ncbi:hypothetical protein Rrhod_2346 [Rhodococcus rhodnii LMG 5362]|uniref:Uncharacterized protein n=1 Tax=Rhodococcus rhodnii LMG 5362 TaxID=1273125 RepID=R7WM56_9NOCA|nr:hypothetical protein Rrhod_2346 [Rhodococcus rhodnii LMG 5362]
MEVVVCVGCVVGHVLDDPRPCPECTPACSIGKTGSIGDTCVSRDPP